MDRIYVLLQIYIKIDIILLLGKLWMKLECYMCVQTLGGMYNNRGPIYKIHHIL